MPYSKLYTYARILWYIYVGAFVPQQTSFEMGIYLSHHMVCWTGEEKFKTPITFTIYIFSRWIAMEYFVCMIFMKCRYARWNLFVICSSNNKSCLLLDPCSYFLSRLGVEWSRGIASALWTAPVICRLTFQLINISLCTKYTKFCLFNCVVSVCFLEQWCECYIKGLVVMKVTRGLWL